MKYLIQYKSFPFICQRDWEPHDCISRRITITPRTTTLLFKEQVSFPRNSRRSRRISDDSYYPIGHVRYINIPTWLRGFRVKIVNFLSLFCLPIPKRDLDTKKTQPNIEVCPESLGAMLEYWYIERGLLHTSPNTQKNYDLMVCEVD